MRHEAVSRAARTWVAPLALVLTLAGLAPAPALAQPTAEASPPVERAARVRPGRTPVDDLAPVWVAAGGASLGVGLGLFLWPTSPPADPQVGVWRGGLLFDEGFRDMTRAPTLGGSEMARRISDVLLTATIAQAAITDSVIVPLLQDDPDLVWQASAAHALALGLMLSAGSVVKRVTERARPFERACADDPSAPGCNAGDTYNSFFSLHSGVAFTSAGFSCAMHLERNLYGDQGADIVSCGTSLAAATVTGLLRVVADVHYLSDVLVGAVAGFLIGYLVPLAIVPQRVPVRDEPEGELDLPEGAETIPTTPGMTWSAAPLVELDRERGGFTLGVSVSGTF